MNVISQDIQTCSADLTKFEDCLEITKGVDYVFHAAGAVGSAAATPTHAMGDIITNLSVPSQMLRAAWQTGVE